MNDGSSPPREAGIAPVAPIAPIEQGLDLPAYFERIEYDGPLEPTEETLAALHIAHATHIPFENLDILLGRPIELGLDRLQAKLVSARRGGYCFEQNLLFDAVLRSVGFNVRKLAARVRLGTQRMLPRTHTLLLVEAEGQRFIADVGFGMEGLLLPVALEDGREARQHGWTYRVLGGPDAWAMQALQDGQWRDLYVFSLEAQERIDYEVANFYVSTHPTSRFVQMLTAQRLTPSMRYMLRDFEFEEHTASSRSTRTLAGEQERLQVLDQTFGLSFPPDTRFRTHP